MRKKDFIFTSEFIYYKKELIGYFGNYYQGIIKLLTDDKNISDFLLDMGFIIKH